MPCDPPGIDRELTLGLQGIGEEHSKMTQKASNNVWQQEGEQFFPSNTSLNVKTIPPGIYKYMSLPTGTWWLEKSADRYAFPYKIYGVNDSIIDRVRRAWSGLPSNLGVLLNGLKGTGKTITAQQIVNWALDERLIVLNVQHPVPLAAILERVEQDMLVLFDEFEKTHNEQQIPGIQQGLLSAIDGLSKSDFKRLFLFTTNEVRVNENLIDRPSRIRYRWEFTRVNHELIEMLLDDMLNPELKALRPDIIKYLNSREVLTIDVVKAVITECNIFKQSPDEFSRFMNLTEKTPASFKLEIVEEGLGGAAVEVSSYFKTVASGVLMSLLTKSGQKRFVEDNVAINRVLSINSTTYQYIEIVGPTDKVDEWICHVQLPTHKTWVDHHPNLRRRASTYLWLDEQPKEWSTPDWVRKLESNTPLTKDEEAALERWLESDSLHDSGKKKKVRVRFTVDDKPFAYDFRTFLA